MAKKIEDKKAEQTKSVASTDQKTTSSEVKKTPVEKATSKKEAPSSANIEIPTTLATEAASPAFKSKEDAKIQPKATSPAPKPVEDSKTNEAPAPVVLEPGRAICHELFHDGRVRRITAMDEPEFSGQHHYMLEIQETDPNLGIVKKVHREDIRFQKGSLQTAGPNGWTEADLIKILIDRLENFSNLGVAQPENEQALKGLREAYAALDKRRKRKIAEREMVLAAARETKAAVPKPIIY
jgi:hypothetical protein